MADEYALLDKVIRVFKKHMANVKQPEMHDKFLTNFSQICACYVQSLRYWNETTFRLNDQMEFYKNEANLVKEYEDYEEDVEDDVTLDEIVVKKEDTYTNLDSSMTVIEEDEDVDSSPSKKICT